MGRENEDAHHQSFFNKFLPRVIPYVPRQLLGSFWYFVNASDGRWDPGDSTNGGCTRILFRLDAIVNRGFAWGFSIHVLRGIEKVSAAAEAGDFTASSRISSFNLELTADECGVDRGIDHVKDIGFDSHVSLSSHSLAVTSI
jgi:hypothetical protein